MKKEKEIKYKVCKNKHCNNKFYRRTHETINAFRIRTFCTRKCQQYWRNVRKGLPTTDKSFSYVNMHDSLTRAMLESRDRINKTQVTIYSNKNLSQEELKSLIPSLKGN